MGAIGSTLIAIGMALANQVRAPAGRAVVQQIPALAPGVAGELSVTVLETPASGTPIELRLWVPEGMTVVSNRLGWDDVVDVRAVQPRLRARFVAPNEAGEYVVRGLLRYLRCDQKVCLPKVAHISWTVEVAPPAVAQPL